MLHWDPCERLLLAPSEGFPCAGSRWIGLLHALPPQTQIEQGGIRSRISQLTVLINVWKTRSEIELGPFQYANILEHIDHAYGNSPGPESLGKTQIAPRDSSLSAAWKLHSITGDPSEPRKRDIQPAETLASPRRISGSLASAAP